MNVRFFNVRLLETYLALEVKDPAALYFIQDAQRLYQGDKLIGVGAEASEAAAGLLSAEDYAKLQELAATVPTIEERLAAVEGSIVGGVHYKGSVPTVADLPADAAQGDMYEVLEDNSEWCFNGEKWFEYGHTVDFSPIAGDGITVDGRKVSIDIADDAHGLIINEDGLAMELANAEHDGAMSKNDKAFIDSIPDIYADIDRVEDTAIQRKYNISNVPEGTLVNYAEDEIRIMCPADAKFVKQEVGNGGNANMYYMTFTTYAPEGAVTFKEGDRGVIIDEVLNFETTAGTGVDKYGRKYKNHWFALASYDGASWTYFGKNSKPEKYIGWDYCVEWYDANGVKFASDNIRINLSNEDCHDVSLPYYMAKYATKEDVATVAVWETL